MKILSDEMLQGIADHINREFEQQGVVKGQGEDYRIDTGLLAEACTSAAYCSEDPEEPDLAWEAFQAAVTADPKLSKLRGIMANVDGPSHGVGESHRASADFWEAVAETPRSQPALC